jgi:mannose-6-phosphate isomerase
LCPEHLRLSVSWLATLGRAYPGDGGVAVASLLNCVRIQPGESLFLGAGNMHAYLHGLGVEIMANSDNVVRGGLTEKHIDVNVLADLVDTSPAPVPLVAVERFLLAGGARVESWPVPVTDFSLLRVGVSAPDAGALTMGNHPAVVLCSAGTVEVIGHTGTGPDEIITRLTLSQGQAVYAAAAQRISFSGYGECFVASSTE